MSRFTALLDRTTLRERVTVSLTRPSGTSTFDADTGEETPSSPATLYTGEALVYSAQSRDAGPQFGQHDRSLRLWYVLVPTTVTDVLRGDEVDVTSASVEDQVLIGRTLRVVTFDLGNKVAHRIQAEEVEIP